MRFPGILKYFLFLFLLPNWAAAQDWGATLSSGPLVPDLTSFEAGWSGDQVNAESFGKRYVRAPRDGVILGSGWDYVLNTKTFSTCIDFEKTKDDYTTVQSSVADISDDETRDIALNANFSGNLGVNIADLLSANAADKLGIEWSTHYNSKDRELIARATAINGPEFAVPPGSNAVMKNRSYLTDLASAPILSIALTSQAEALRKTDPDAFRKKCGDGFVGGIVSGAELVIRLHIRDVDQNSRYVFEQHGKAGFNFLGILDGGGSDDLKSVITTARNQKRLDITFYQSGGKNSTPASDLASAKAAYDALPTQAASNPMPVYLIVYPYDSLSSCFACGLPGTATLREKAIRYYVRLASVFDQTRIEKENYERVRQPLSQDEYLFSYRHRLRDEDLGKLKDNLSAEMARVATIVSALDGKECSAANSSKAKGASDCVSLVNGLIKPDEKFDDLQYWIRLPLPWNALSKEDRDLIVSIGGDTDAKRKTYSEDLYRHWIERVDAVRCRITRECLSESQLRGYRQLITRSLSSELLPQALQSGDPALLPGVELSLRVEKGEGLVLHDVGGGWPYEYELYTRDINGGKWKLIKTLRSCACAVGNPTYLKGADAAYELGVIAYGNAFGRRVRWPTDLLKRFFQNDAVTATMDFQQRGAVSNLDIVAEASPDPSFQ